MVMHVFQQNFFLFFEFRSNFVNLNQQVPRSNTLVGCRAKAWSHCFTRQPSDAVAESRMIALLSQLRDLFFMMVQNLQFRETYTHGHIFQIIITNSCNYVQNLQKLKMNINWSIFTSFRVQWIYVVQWFCFAVCWLSFLWVWK